MKKIKNVLVPTDFSAGASDGMWEGKKSIDRGGEIKKGHQQNDRESSSEEKHD